MKFGMNKLPLHVLYLWMIHRSQKTKKNIPFTYTRIQKVIPYMNENSELISKYFNIKEENQSNLYHNESKFDGRYIIPHTGEYSKVIQIHIETNLTSGILKFVKVDRDKKRETGFYRHSLEITKRGRLYLRYMINQIEDEEDYNAIKILIDEVNDLTEFQLIQKTYKNIELGDFKQNSELRFLGLLPSLSEIDLKWIYERIERIKKHQISITDKENNNVEKTIKRKELEDSKNKKQRNDLGNIFSDYKITKLQELKQYNPTELSFNFRFRERYVNQWKKVFSYPSDKKDSEENKDFEKRLKHVSYDLELSEHVVTIFPEGLIQIQSNVNRRNYREIVRQYVEFCLTLINELEEHHILSKISEVSYSHGSGIFYYKSEIQALGHRDSSNRPIPDTEFFQSFIEELSEYIKTIKDEMLDLFKITATELQMPLSGRGSRIFSIWKILRTKLASRSKKEYDFNNNLVTLQTSAFRSVINFTIFEKAMERFKNTDTKYKFICYPEDEHSKFKDHEEIKKMKEQLGRLQTEGANLARFFKEISHSLTLPIQEYTTHFSHLGIILTIIGIGISITVSRISAPLTLEILGRWSNNKILLSNLQSLDALAIAGGVITIGGILSLIYISNLNSLKKPMRGIARTFNIPDKLDDKE